MAKSVGRKVYRSNVNDRKKKARKAAKVVLVIIVLAALGFLGYCIANPVFEYLGKRGEGNSVADGTKPWTPPVLQEGEDEGEENPENNAADNSDQRSPASDEERKKPGAGRFSAYRLPVSALASTTTLAEALSSAKEGGYTAVIAVLKDKGGKIYYHTDSEMAKSDETALAGSMAAGQICGMIKSAGFTPIAELNLLEDNNRYGERRNGSYHFASDNSTWLDNSVANGGKPWLSPFDTETQSYAAYLSNEAASAGFEYIVFDGLTFPNFRNSDLTHIGAIVQSPDRYKALVNIENISAGASGPNGSASIVMTSAADIIGGTEEIFKPAELSSEIIAVTYDPAEFGGTMIIGGQEIALSDLTVYETAETVFAEVMRLAGNDKAIIPAVKQSDFSQSDFNDVISAAISLGLDSYIIM